jgi:hypothetical protein
MRWRVVRTTVREHEAAADLPPVFSADVHLEGTKEGDPVTLADLQALLANAVTQGVPTTATLGTSVDLSFRWT